MYIVSDKQSDYSADFKKMVVYVTDRVSRISDPIKVNFTGQEFIGILPDIVLLYLLPHYSRWLDDSESREESQRLYRRLSYDLDDSACRNFNSFNGGKGE